MSLWRRFTAAYATLLSWLLAVSVAILVIPVSLQIFSRYTALIPSFIWTEEMARFLFIWTDHDRRHDRRAQVDPLRGRRVAASVASGEKPWCGCSAASGVLAAALVFVWAGIHFTQFAWNRISELAELPLWLIYVAWPITGATWLVFLGEQLLDDLRTIFGRTA